MAAFNAAATAPAAYVVESVSVAVPDASRFARLFSDISKGAWQPSTGNDLYAMLNEVTPDSSTYISTTGIDACEMALGAVVDPGTSTNQVVFFEAHATAGGRLTVNLKQGAATIASKTIDPLPTVYTVHELRLTGAECDAITDYGNLRLEYDPN
jgi:hypothetical protein